MKSNIACSFKKKLEVKYVLVGILIAWLRNLIIVVVVYNVEENKWVNGGFWNPKKMVT